MITLYQKIRSNPSFDIIITVLLIGNIFFFGSTIYLKFYYVNSYPFLDKATNFTHQEDYIVNLDPLRDYLNGLNQKLGPDKMTLYLEFLNSGSNISINRDLGVFPASLAKLPLGILIMKKIELGELHSRDLVEVQDEDIDERSGQLYRSLPGTSYTIDELLRALLIDSDNTAQHMLLRKVTGEDMQDLISETGLEALADPQGKISAKEYTRFFRVLYTSSYLERKDSQLILKLLSESTFKGFLSQGVPSMETFSHKYGEDKGAQIYSDSGIVYLKNRPYMITLMLQGMDEAAAKKVMKDVSETVYQYFSHFNPTIRTR